MGKRSRSEVCRKNGGQKEMVRERGGSVQYKYIRAKREKMLRKKSGNL